MVRFGVQPIFHRDLTTKPAWIKSFVKMIEDTGADSIWAVEHPVIAENYEPLYSYSADGKAPFFPEVMMPDPLEWLSFVAACTDKIKLATGILILPLHSPIIIAKRVASLRNPSNHTFEDKTPDGRVYAIRRRRVDAGGVVTIMTDISEQKQAALALLDAKQRTEAANNLVTEKNRMLESLSSKLAKYLSPQLYRSIFSGEQDVAIASKRKKLTIFFSDIAGFTETTDNLESEDLTDVLNHYLTEMSAIALRHGATIDKYIGDAMLLFFGDPDTKGVREDAKACVMMAIAMQRRMRELEQEWRDRGLERPFRIRMGICTGFCTVGNFGSPDRLRRARLERRRDRPRAGSPGRRARVPRR